MPPHRFIDPEHDRAENFDWPTAYALTLQLADKLQDQNFIPDVLLAINDPDSAGGFIVGSQLAAILNHRAGSRPVVMEEIGIGGTGSERRVTSTPPLPSDATNILIVDDAAWSGNTLEIAAKAVKGRTNGAVRTATVVAGAPAIAQQRVDFYARSSQARDVRFPWGTVRPTSEISQYFQLPDTTSPREVSWAPRPWGYWEQFALNEMCTVRLLTILPGESLSLQYHNHRDEFFVALDDEITLRVGDEEIIAKSGDYVLIPRKVLHRQSAPQAHSVRVLEVSFGHYDQVKDIVRLDDRYGRTDFDGSV
jgi:mannose-6-phosphate isomerase